jgi:subtilisin
MTRLIRVVLVAGIAAIVVAPLSHADKRPAKRYIVVLKQDVAHPGRVAKEHGRRLGFSAHFVYRHALKGYAASVPPGQARTLLADRRVALVAPDRPVTVDDPKVTFGITADQVVPTGVDRVQADVSAAADIDGNDEPLDVDVAVIDTGVDVDHPDLDVAGGVNCISPAPHRTAFDDRNGHGTHVAGTAAAIDNGIGVVGVAPGARVWAVRVLNPAGSGSFSSVICGVDWVTEHANTIEVANMSLGGSGVPDDGNCGRTIGDPLHLAICNSVDALRCCRRELRGGRRGTGICPGRI